MSKMLTGSLLEPILTILIPVAVGFFCSRAPWSIDIIAFIFGLDIVWK